MPLRRLFCLTICVLVCGTAASEDDAALSQWGHWRGPLANGVSLTARPPVEFGRDKNVQWKAELPGLGSSSPVVWGDRVFVTTAVTSSRPGSLTPHDFTVLCYRRETGELLWQRVAIRATPHQETHATNGFASASPCTDGTHVYAHFGSRGLYCYDLDGNLIWKRTDFGNMQTRNGFGEGSSPTLFDRYLLVPWDHEGPSSLYALDKSTGQTIWQTPRDEPTNWATPMVFTGGEQPQVIMNGENFVRSYDLETGQELWRCGGQTERPAASPVAMGDLVLVGSGFRGAYLAAFRTDGRGDIEGSDAVVWDVDADTPDIASPLLSDGRLYFYKGKTGLLTCVDAATGKPFFRAARVDGLSNIYASPVAAGGHVYLTDRSGTITVIQDGPTLRIVAVNEMGETVDATPAPVGDQLFVRGEKHLFCLRQP